MNLRLTRGRIDYTLACTVYLCFEKIGFARGGSRSEKVRARCRSGKKTHDFFIIYVCLCDTFPQRIRPVCYKRNEYE